MQYKTKTMPLVEWFFSQLDTEDDGGVNYTFPNFPKMNIKSHKEKGWKIEMALAGYLKDEISITLEGGVLTVATKDDRLKEKDDYVFLRDCRGITTQNFSQSFRLSEDILDLKGISSKFDNGLLTIIIPLKAEAIPEKRNISIS
jgi:HSP20 family protein